MNINETVITVSKPKWTDIFSSFCLKIICYYWKALKAGKCSLFLLFIFKNAHVMHFWIMWNYHFDMCYWTKLLLSSHERTQYSRDSLKVHQSWKIWNNVSLKLWQDTAEISVITWKNVNNSLQPIKFTTSNSKISTRLKFFITWGMVKLGHDRSLSWLGKFETSTVFHLLSVWKQHFKINSTIVEKHVDAFQSGQEK